MMGLALKLGLSAPFVASGAWTPASLFGASEAGFFYNYTLLTGSENDDVTAVTDQSGNGNDATVYSSRTPRLGFDSSSVAYLKPTTAASGIATLTSGVAITGATARSVFSGASLATGANEAIMDGGAASGGSRFLFWVFSTGVLRFNQGALNVDSALSATTTATRVFGYIHDGSSTISGTVYLDAATSTLTNGNTVNTTATPAILTSGQASIKAPARKYWDLAIARVLTADEITSLRNWHADLGAQA